jgi:GntP family gluconate:H+ symporter
MNDAAVATSPLLALAAFGGVIVLLLFLIARWRWHVFLALLVPLLLFGVIPGVQTNNFIRASNRPASSSRRGLVRFY